MRQILIDVLECFYLAVILFVSYVCLLAMHYYFLTL